VIRPLPVREIGFGFFKAGAASPTEKRLFMANTHLPVAAGGGIPMEHVFAEVGRED